MTAQNPDSKTHFGYQTVDIDAKQKMVADVFHSVAPKYDIMNDLMSLGVHRLWKRHAIDCLNVKPEHLVLDLAGGTGDLTQLILKKGLNKVKVCLADINASMLQEGRARLLDKGLIHTPIVQLNAECLPFADNQFDRIIIGFGLRNVTNKDKALASMFRVLKPGGKLVVLEFSKPISTPVQKFYDLYSFKLLPWLGEKIANDAKSYQYLAESIRMHPGQEELKNMFEQAGFLQCRYHNLSQGIVAVHTGYKL